MADSEIKKIKRKKGDVLSRKQKIFVEEYIKTGHGTNSALKAYDTKDEHVARSIATENLTKPVIIKEIMSAADRIPDDLIEQVHLEGLQSTDIMHRPDYAVRHKYLDTAYKLKGSYAPEKSVQIVVDNDNKNRLNEALIKYLHGRNNTTDITG